jgi:sulfane dehydrogenase subunit SoxC
MNQGEIVSMVDIVKQPGRLRRAPENFLSEAEIKAVGEGRRDFLRRSFLTAAGAAMTAPLLARASEGDANILQNPEWTTTLGQPVAVRPYGLPSKHESQLVRRESPGLTRVGAASVSFAPLAGLFGIITPSGLHFERHHQGWYDIDPASAPADGQRPGVKQAKVYTMDDLMRLPSVSRIHFIECGANTGMEWGNVAVPTGAVHARHAVLFRIHRRAAVLLLDDCGIDRKKGEVRPGRRRRRIQHDAHHPARTRARVDVLVAYGQNGEMLRPENGYPLRLVVPGVQGVSWVKWLRRIEVGDQPWATKDEAVHYIDLMPDGTASPIHLDPGVQVGDHHALRWPDPARQGLLQHHRLAWSGRGKIKRVDVSTDGGINWRPAR